MNIEQIALQKITVFIAENPGMTKREVMRSITGLSAPMRNHVGRDIDKLKDEGTVIEIYGSDRKKCLYSGLTKEAIRCLRMCKDDHGQPLRVYAKFTKAPSFIQPAASPIDWAMKNILRHA